jgi:hypothetical protein
VQFEPEMLQKPHQLGVLEIQRSRLGTFHLPNIGDGVDAVVGQAMSLFTQSMASSLVFANPIICVQNIAS